MPAKSDMASPVICGSKTKLGTSIVPMLVGKSLVALIKYVSIPKLELTATTLCNMVEY